VAHLSQAQPDRSFGPKQNPFIYRIPGENQDISTQMAFTMPGDDDNIYERDHRSDDTNFFALLAFLDMDKPWGAADWASQARKDYDFTVSGSLEAPVVFSPEDTWETATSS
jgi:hypothetical protein